MANTPGKADHKATASSSTIPGLTLERTKSIVLLLVQLFSVLQTGLSIAGVSQLPFTTDQVSTAITGVIAVIASVWAWWRNNNVTEAAVQGQQLTNAIRNGSIATTQGTSPAPEAAQPVDETSLYKTDENGDTVLDTVTGTPVISVE